MRNDLPKRAIYKDQIFQSGFGFFFLIQKSNCNFMSRQTKKRANFFCITYKLISFDSCKWCHGAQLLCFCDDFPYSCFTQSFQALMELLWAKPGFSMVHLPHQLIPGTPLWDAWRVGTGNCTDFREGFSGLFIINSFPRCRSAHCVKGCRRKTCRCLVFIYLVSQ